ncbi:hypothetical protein MLOOGBEN_17565 [Bacillus sp. EB106-08-02-XG196]|uniref:hypothetical protein n=1 Tax=Bacillus sp. EB106-08-02-XG196 TaxID=2737049 RepID=UPI0015C47E09|nr:hypothetical protein [Bacillus sp. EB106-08-02-XG196]NWQ42513.1 hypothetical protein [Bacillus sp. EB106-08-02-XG196]
MEETLNSILLELKQLNKDQQELMIGQKELIGRIEDLEKGHKKLMTSSTKNTNKVYEELITGQRQLKVRIENLENIKDFFSLGKNELKELMIRTTAYMSGKLSVSERMKLEIEWLNTSERQELLNNINEKNIVRSGNTWSEDWDNDY